MPNLPISVQLYSLRRMAGGLDAILSAVAKAGFTAVETVNDHGISASDMQDLLDQYNLTVSSSHVGIQVLQENLAHVINFNKFLGNPVVVVPAPYGPMWTSSTAEDWRNLGRDLDAIGAKLRAAGMRLLYHNHGIEMQMHDGKRAIDWLFGAADPAHLNFEPDLAWIAHGGADPVEILGQYAGRCPRVHVKDLAAPGTADNEKGLADVGYGILDWPTILPAAKAAGAQWYVVEHDEPTDPAASVKRSLDYLRSVGELL